MDAGLVVAITVGSAVLSFVYIFSVVTIFMYPKVFYPYPYEVFGMLINGAIGIAGYALYVGNIPISGGINNVHDITKNCGDTINCNDARAYLFDYQILSTFRFLCWYVEYAVSYIYIAFFLSYRRFMTLLRYSIHTLNVTLSLVTLLIVSNNEFPKRFILGSRSFAPVVAQGLILVWVIMSYWFIAQSRLYRVQCVSSRTARFISRPFWRLKLRNIRMIEE